mgnify:CR=1 FL=1
MAISLPQSVKKVLQDKAYGHVVTFSRDGKPQLTMVWIDVEDDEVLFNTAQARLLEHEAVIWFHRHSPSKLSQTEFVTVRL